MKRRKCPPGYDSKRARLDRRAREMREHNLTHGTGCKSTARAIEQRSELPTIEQQIAELEAAGWRAMTSIIWRAPQGTLFLGPHGAWKSMRAIAKRTGGAQCTG